MLLVGTTEALWDLERSYSLASDAVVTAIAGREPSRAWAMLDRQRIVVVDQFDVQELAALDEPDGQSLAVLPDSALIIGRSGARLAIMQSADSTIEPLSAFLDLPGRESWKNPAASTPDLRSLACDDGGRIFANVHVGGLWWSDDRGVSWSQAVEPDADVHQVAVGSGGRVAVAAAIGLGWSNDRGQTWRWTTEGLHDSYCRAVAFDDDGAYISASTGPFSGRAMLYRAPRLGEGFTKCAGGLPEWFDSNIDTATLSVGLARVVFGTADGQVWTSVDHGDTWTETEADRGRVTAIVA